MNESNSNRYSLFKKDSKKVIGGSHGSFIGGNKDYISFTVGLGLVFRV